MGWIERVVGLVLSYFLRLETQRLVSCFGVTSCSNSTRVCCCLRGCSAPKLVAFSPVSATRSLMDDEGARLCG